MHVATTYASKLTGCVHTKAGYYSLVKSHAEYNLNESCEACIK